GRRFERGLRELHLHAWIREHVHHPVRAPAVLGQDVDAPFPIHEPDLDLTRQAGLAAGRGDVDVRLVGEAHAPPVYSFTLLVRDVPGRALVDLDEVPADGSSELVFG